MASGKWKIGIVALGLWAACRPSVPAGADETAPPRQTPAVQETRAWQPLATRAVREQARAILLARLWRPVPAPDVIVQLLQQTAAEADETARQECQFGNGASCRIAAAQSHDGSPQGLEAMLSWLAMGCMQGDTLSCDWTLSALTRMEALAQLEERLAPACARGQQAACATIAFAQTDAEGAPDTVHVSAFEAACHAGHAPSCVFLGVLYMRQGQDTAARQVLGPQCASADATACTAIAALRLAEPDDEAAGDASRFLLQQCNSASEAAACLMAGALEMPEDVTTPLSEAVEATLRQACSLGQSLGCQVLGERLLVTLPQPDGLEAAVPWLVTGCNLGAGAACYALASELRDGLQTEADDNEMIRELVRRACIEGVDDACSLGSAARRSQP